jgi:hypothetical protein
MTDSNNNIIALDCGIMGRIDPLLVQPTHSQPISLRSISVVESHKLIYAKIQF